MEHFNPKCCNVFNFTPSDGVAPFLGLPGGGKERGRRGIEGMAGGVGVSRACRKQDLREKENQKQEEAV